MLSGLTPEQQALKEFDQVNGLKSTFYLGKRILKYDFYELPHRGICNFIDQTEQTKAALLLDPRGCFKTSIVSQAYPARRILQNPNIRILLDSVALSNSQHNLQVIRRFFEGNARVRELYGDFYAKDRTWNDTEFTVKKRTNDKLKEATVTASGIDKIQIGPHYDIIIADDLHNRDNHKTVEQVEKVKEHIRLIFGLLEPGGEIIVAGHRWSYTDAYSMVMGDTEKAEEREFAELFKGKTYIHGARNRDGSYYFPDWGKRCQPPITTEEYLHRQRISLGIEMYSAMLENEPVLAGDGQKFEKRYFKRYDKLPCHEKDPVPMNRYLTIDPGGKRKGNDNWVLFDGSMCPKGYQYFERYLKKLSKASLAAEDIYRWWLQAKQEGRPYRKIGFETSGQQGQILESIKDYLWEKYQVMLPFKELPHSEDSKNTRIESMGPRYESGRIFHSAQMGETFGLEDQLVKFPKGADDIADAAAMQEEVAQAPRVEVRRPEPKNLDEQIARHLEDQFSGKPEIKREHPVLGCDY